MPVYEFHCSKCKSVFDVMRPVSCAEQGASCPQCHMEGRRVFSPFIAFNRFAKVEEGHQPIAGTMGSGSCSSCAGGSCDTCH